MALLNAKVKAATLMEAMVAMVIVMICFGIASMIYVNVLNADRNSILISAHLTMATLAEKTKESNTFLDEKIVGERLAIQKAVEPYQAIPGLFLVKYTAADKEGKIVAEYKELVLQP